jgi:hypothetical protein
MPHRKAYRSCQAGVVLFHGGGREGFLDCLWVQGDDGRCAERWCKRPGWGRDARCWVGRRPLDNGISDDLPATADRLPDSGDLLDPSSGAKITPLGETPLLGNGRVDNIGKSQDHCMSIQVLAIKPV